VAELFSVNRSAVDRVRSDLDQIRSNLLSLETRFAGAADVTGSPRVEAALEKFVRESSDNRARMIDLLDRGSYLMRSLVEGTGAMDLGLADALWGDR
jgi:hypothetical protein